MNINQMSMDQAADAMIRISAAASFIFEDPDVVQLINDITESEGTSIMVWIPKYLTRITTLALRKHRESVYEIIGALGQKDRKAVGQMSLTEVIALIRENWSALQDFFPTSGGSEQTGQPSA